MYDSLAVPTGDHFIVLGNLIRCDRQVFVDSRSPVSCPVGRPFAISVEEEEGDAEVITVICWSKFQRPASKSKTKSWVE